MGKPAARITDLHTCPMFDGPKPHVGGPIIPPCCPTVLIGGIPAARVGDTAMCAGPPDMIIQGSATVFIGGKPAARMGDATSHGGIITTGLPTVLIGDASAQNPGASGMVALYHKAQSLLGVPGSDLSVIADEVNPLNGNVNCGNIIDAVRARLMGNNKSATAPIDRDGSFPEIESRFNTSIDWGTSFQDIFDAVENGGHGTIGVVGVVYSDGNSHVIIIANHRGKVGIVEGQGGGQLISSPKQADKAYNHDGRSMIGVGILREKFK